MGMSIYCAILWFLEPFDTFIKDYPVKGLCGRVYRLKGISLKLEFVNQRAHVSRMWYFKPLLSVCTPYTTCFVIYIYIYTFEYF